MLRPGIDGATCSPVPTRGHCHRFPAEPGAGLGFLLIRSKAPTGLSEATNGVNYLQEHYTA